MYKVKAYCGAEQQGDVVTIPRMTVLVVGATGSIGRLVVNEAPRQGHAVRWCATPARQVNCRLKHRWSLVTLTALQSEYSLWLACAGEGSAADA